MRKGVYKVDKKFANILVFMRSTTAVVGHIF